MSRSQSFFVYGKSTYFHKGSPIPSLLNKRGKTGKIPLATFCNTSSKGFPSKEMLLSKRTRKIQHSTILDLFHIIAFLKWTPSEIKSRLMQKVVRFFGPFDIEAATVLYINKCFMKLKKQFTALGHSFSPLEARPSFSFPLWYATRGEESKSVFPHKKGAEKKNRLFPVFLSCPFFLSRGKPRVWAAGG